jgi:uncharacterized membrane protein
MKAFGFLLAVALVSTLSIAGSLRPASADLQFCNQTTSDSYIQEGHHTAHTGLTVHGTITVKKGTCGVVVPGRLTPHSYYLRVLNNHESYGGDNRLCVLNMADFTIAAEDKPGFKCRDSIATFMSIPSYGHSTMIVTQRKDASIHFVLK